ECATVARQSQKFLCGRFHRAAPGKRRYLLSCSVRNLLQSQRRRRTSAPTVTGRIPGYYHGEVGVPYCPVGVPSRVSSNVVSIQTVSIRELVGNLTTSYTSTPPLLAGPSDSLRADVPGDRLMLLQLVGSFVLVLEGATPTQCPATRR